MIDGNILLFGEDVSNDQIILHESEESCSLNLPTISTTYTEPVDESTHLFWNNSQTRRILNGAGQESKAGGSD